MYHQDLISTANDYFNRTRGLVIRKLEFEFWSAVDLNKNLFIICAISLSTRRSYEGASSDGIHNVQGNIWTILRSF